MKLLVYKLYCQISITYFVLFSCEFAIAQSTKIDGTTLTQITNDCSINCTIEGGLQQGLNLFHSFEKFNVDAGAIVQFQDPGVTNILGRVTGNELSEILGTLGVNGGNANLFLINPNGVVFGQNSSLDLNGSFLATSADGIRFGDQGLLYTVPNTIPILTINPSALTFSDNNHGTIRNESVASAGEDSSSFEVSGLEVPEGNSLVFVGGNIFFDEGSSFASGGRIELGAISAIEEVQLNIFDENISLSFPENFSGADIILNNSSFVQTISESGSGGNIAINARNLFVSGQSQIFTGIIMSADENTRGGDITINATNRLEIERSAIGNQTLFQGTSGDINLNAGSLFIRGRSFIQTSVLGTGNAGTININVPGGTIEILGNSPEESPNINSSIDIDGKGNSGGIMITAREMILDNNALIQASNFGEGDAGDINILLQEELTLSSNSVISSIIEPGALGTAGSINIETGELNVAGGSEIEVSAEGLGEAGSQDITARNITLNNGTLISETQVGSQGNIELSNVDTLLLRNNSQITTNATEAATGGDITLSSEAIAALDNSDITANAVEGRGGNIQITTQGIFQEPDSQITAASQLGFDGTITFNTPDVDPAAGIFELPEIPLDTENILAQDLCKLEDEKIAKGSSFIITGRGGLAPTSEESLGNRDRIVNWTSREDLEVSDSGAVGIRQREEEDLAKQTYPKIQQSQGLFVADDGSTWLTANAVNADSQGAKIKHPDCQTQSSATKD